MAQAVSGPASGATKKRAKTAAKRGKSVVSRAKKLLPTLKSAAMQIGPVLGVSALASVASGFRGAGGLDVPVLDRVKLLKDYGLADARAVGGVLGILLGMWSPRYRANALTASTGLLVSWANEKGFEYGAKMKPAAAAPAAKGVVIGHVGDIEGADEGGRLSLEERIAKAGAKGKLRRLRRLEKRYEARTGHESEWARKHPKGVAAHAVPGGYERPMGRRAHEFYG